MALKAHSNILSLKTTVALKALSKNSHKNIVALKAHNTIEIYNGPNINIKIAKIRLKIFLKKKMKSKGF